MVIEVAFKGNRREFFEWPFPEAPALKTPVIVEVERGEDIGHVHATGDLALKRRAGTTHGKASRNPLRKAVRAANGDEVARAQQLRADEHNVRVRAIEKVRSLGLDLKVSDTEWQWDKKRLTVYFTAEQRVDFRQLVRQLEGLFGTRVHMWHIGVRDEARRLDGVGRCGRQLCSAGWLPELVPVKSSVAKDQHLSTLNPSQISGACGRLMCCLRYEHEFYVEQRRRFPKEGKIVRSAAGEEKCLSVDIFRETVTLRSVAGETRVVPLQRLREDLVGDLPAWATRADGAVAAPHDEGADTDRFAADDSADDVGTEAEGGEGPADRQAGAPDAPDGSAQHRGGGRKRRRGRRGGRRSRGAKDTRPGPGPSDEPGQAAPPGQSAPASPEPDHRPGWPGPGNHTDRTPT